MFLGTYLIFKSRRFPFDKRIFVWIPIILMVFHFITIHLYYFKAVRNGEGFWGLQNDWEQMQRYVRGNTPKNSLILIPHDMEMGGFRILSERKVLCCYRDCGIIGFDYNAALEWQNRLKDIEAFQVFLDPRKNMQSALFNAIIKYKVDYIVFMNYYAPPQDLPGIKKIYQNNHFALYKIDILPQESPI